MNSTIVITIESLSNFKASLFIIFFILLIISGFYFNHTIHLHNQQVIFYCSTSYLAKHMQIQIMLFTTINI